MRWFQVKKANISPELRQTLEQYGPETLRALLPNPPYSIETQDGTPIEWYRIARLVFYWLKEQADREERRETWLITMEIAITAFVLLELLISVLALFRSASH